MTSDEKSPAEMRDALQDAFVHAQRRDDAAAASEGMEPRGRGRGLLIACALLTIVTAWDVFELTRSPEMLPPIEEEADLRTLAATAVQTIEDFRVVEGRLPTVDEVEAVVDEVVSYSISGAGYVVQAEGVHVSVRYDGSVPLETWVAERSAAGAAEPEVPS